MLLALAFSLTIVDSQLPANYLGHHKAVYDRQGILQPWTSWIDALTREMKWYENCPTTHGYPLFATVTFMDGQYKVSADRNDCIPAMQNGVGILSYLEYDELTHQEDHAVLAAARKMGDYILDQALTPNDGQYPRFPRSTGRVDKWPQPPNCGSQDDQPLEIQPDKGAIAGYALLELYRVTREARYQQAALRIARTLVRHERTGDATHSPWPFRANYMTGATRNEISGDSAFFLRLFDGLIAEGFVEFSDPRAKMWDWVKKFQIPSAAVEGALFVQFFEDHHNDNNRSAWSPLNLAKYLIERQTAVDPDWQADAKSLIEFVNKTFTHVRFGVTICGEQDEDHDPWGGINSRHVLQSHRRHRIQTPRKTGPNLLPLRGRRHRLPPR
jgi:hypothetical protein